MRLTWIESGQDIATENNLYLLTNRSTSYLSLFIMMCKNEYLFLCCVTFTVDNYNIKRQAWRIAFFVLISFVRGLFVHGNLDGYCRWWFLPLGKTRGIVFQQLHCRGVAPFLQRLWLFYLIFSILILFWSHHPMPGKDCRWYQRNAE